MKKFLILDCYVDEPTCLGVPPFISPYPRYIAGALIDSGISEPEITYATIDDLRGNDLKIDETYDEIFLIGGSVVPGRYLGAKIGSFAEIKNIIESNRQHFSIGGLISHLPMFDKISGSFTLIEKDIEHYAYLKAKGIDTDEWRSAEQVSRWSMLGNFIVTRHHDFPNLIAEIETYRGCPREKRCSFCSENLFTFTDTREQEDIIAEIDSLISIGISRFRIGRQADILCYKSSKEFRNGFPRPDVDEVIKLFSMLKERTESGKIKTLNIDNANPGTIANWPDESGKIIEFIADTVTEGDTIPLGAESFDPAVAAKNSLKGSAEEIKTAVRIINKYGSKRKNGIPKLLPGINLIHGLSGETDATFRINYETLKEMTDEGMLLKRINIRKIQPFPGTPIYDGWKEPSKQVANRYDYYKEKIRNEIDNLMLKKIYPAGTVIRDARVDELFTGYSYARQIASYPIICKIPYELPLKSIHDMIIINHRERSLIALPLPLKVNTLSRKALEMIPGIGKRSSDLILAKPLTAEKIKKLVPEIDEKISSMFDFS